MEGSSLGGILMQFATCVSGVGASYFWLNAFLEKRHWGRKQTLAILFGFAVLRYCAESMDNMLPGILAGFGCSLLFSALLFHYRIKLFFFYVMEGEAIRIAINVLLGNAAAFLLKEAAAGYVPTDLPFGLIEQCLLFLVYYFLIKVSSGRVLLAALERLDLPLGLLFYVVPIMSYSFLAGSCVFEKTLPDNGINSRLIIGSFSALVVNVGVAYLFGRLTKILENVDELERRLVRSELEEKYYREMDAAHEQYDILLHDVRHMMRTIAALLKEANFEEIGRLVSERRETLRNMEQRTVCSHKVLNALLLERQDYADSQNIKLVLEIKEPLLLQNIDELDVITLMGNLLDNAIEAEKHAKKQEGILCQMRMTREGWHMLIQIENSFEEKPESRRPLPKLGRVGNKHGIGLSSVRESVKKYGGIMEWSKTQERYTVKILLPVQGGWESSVENQAQEIPLTN